MSQRSLYEPEHSKLNQEWESGLGGRLGGLGRCYQRKSRRPEEMKDRLEGYGASWWALIFNNPCFDFCAWISVVASVFSLFWEGEEFLFQVGFFNEICKVRTEVKPTVLAPFPGQISEEIPVEVRGQQSRNMAVVINARQWKLEDICWQALAVRIRFFLGIFFQSSSRQPVAFSQGQQVCRAAAERK